jgi:hypothetical protein
VKGSPEGFRFNRAADFNRFGDIHNSARRNFLAEPQTALRSGQLKRIMPVVIHYAFFLSRSRRHTTEDDRVFPTRSAVRKYHWYYYYL